MEPDFSGWATKSDILCTDGRTIKDGAFKHQDKTRVPLVWQHRHSGLDNQLGFAVLEHRDGGTYTYGYFNDTPAGRKAKQLLEHGEISMLSIFADGLTEEGTHVLHGDIQEVSLVRLGANKGATIDNIYLKHEDTGEYEVVEDEAIITTGLSLEHSNANKENNVGDQKNDQKTPTVQEVWDSMTEEQQKLASAVGVMIAESEEDDDEDVTNADGTVTHKDGSVTQTDGTIKHADGRHLNADGTPVVPGKNIKHQEGAPMGQRNAFENNSSIQHDGEKKYGGLLSHSQLTTILTDAKTQFGGSFKKAVLAHADEYGITNIDLLFPDAKSLNSMPDFVKRRTEWVAAVITGTSHTPFTRIKTLTADITHDEARAKGYIKGTMKKDEFFGLKKRVTTPATVYKKQKLDRDDLLDVTEYDVVAWLWLEMRIMIEEELARAILFGDGREVDDDDKIKEPGGTVDGAGIRSIAHDDEFYATPIEVPSNISAQDATELVIRSFEHYRGSGNTTMFTSRGFYVDMLLAKDKMNRRLYDTPVSLAAALGVNRIIPVDLMAEYTDLLAIIVDLRDYSVGTDKGGDLTKFDDFDIDFNQYKYLIETRLSGALTKWKSALVFKKAVGTLIAWDNTYVPTFNESTGVVTIPNKTGVIYKNADTDAVLSAGAQNAIAAGASIEVEASAADTYALPYNLDTDWTFNRPSV